VPTEFRLLDHWPTSSGLVGKAVSDWPFLRFDCDLTRLSEVAWLEELPPEMAASEDAGFGA